MELINNEHSILNAFLDLFHVLCHLFYLLYIFLQKKYTYFLFNFRMVYFRLWWYIFFKRYIFKPIGNYLSNIYQSNNFPIIGRFKRPEGATNCGCFYVKPDEFSFSQGMVVVIVFLVLSTVFMYNFIIDNYKIKLYKSIILFLSYLLFYILCIPEY